MDLLLGQNTGSPILPDFTDFYRFLPISPIGKNMESLQTFTDWIFTGVYRVLPIIMFYRILPNFTDIPSIAYSDILDWYLLPVMEAACT
jgi:hypothetical protein